MDLASVISHLVRRFMKLQGCHDQDTGEELSVASVPLIRLDLVKVLTVPEVVGDECLAPVTEVINFSH